MEKYCDTNLNYYIKIKLTEEGRIIYKKHYAKYNCEAPKLNIDNEGYVQFQIHDFMNIFGERLFMGVTLPCETNCKIQVKDDWHYVKDEGTPTKEGHYLVCLRNKDHDIFDCWILFDKDIGWYSLQVRLVDIYAWKESVLPKESE